MDHQQPPRDDAKALFRKGVECERDGDHYEATLYYKKALKLDPDVEKQIADEDAVLGPTNPIESDESEDEYDQKEELYVRFQRILGLQSCIPEHPQQATHFSDLPSEVVLYIFRWVVSSDLDLITLERCSAVCRGWYLRAKDPDLWRRACWKLWAPHRSDYDTVGFDSSWRRMFIERPHILTHGCYIWKCSYIRRGEESFRDNSNGNVLYDNVCYYRYLRFFSDGRVIMVRTTSPPNKVIRQLKTTEKSSLNVSIGRYELVDNRVLLKLDTGDHGRLLEHHKRNHLSDVIKKTRYKIILEIQNHRSRYNYKLKCVDYKIIYQCRNISTVSDLDVTTQLLRPFYFSRVKSYLTDSQCIL